MQNTRVLPYRESRPDPEQMDSADRDAIVETQRTPGFLLIEARINFEIERQLRSLEQVSDIESTQFTRGAIYALRTMLKIPNILKSEIL